MLLLYHYIWRQDVNIEPHTYNAGIDERIATHPCYSEKAHHHFSRIHLAVAPRCNVQCNYCNRKYDCANESRPGVISERLTPTEALRKIHYVASKLPDLSVVGIAGPGDSLANKEKTFETLRLIRRDFPDLKLCLSTNGLALPENAAMLSQLGVEHVTVTLNTFNPETAQRIYQWVRIDGKKEKGKEAVAYFLNQQQEGIRNLVRHNALVKVNTIYIPGVNEEEIPLIAKKIKLMGVKLHNIMPLISKAEHGTYFGLNGQKEPTDQEIEAARKAGGVVKQMAHCRRCRADAVGRLSQDSFLQFSKEKFADNDSISGDSDREARKQWREKIALLQNKAKCLPPDSSEQPQLIAACSEESGEIDQHFGEASEFYVYQVHKGKVQFLNVRKVEQNYCEGPDFCGEHENRFEKIIAAIRDCQAVICLKVGYEVHQLLEKHGVMPVTEFPYYPMEEAVALTAAQLTERQKKTGRQYAKELTTAAGESK